MKYISSRALFFQVCTLSLMYVTVLVWPLQATPLQEDISNSDKLSIGKSNQVIDNTSNKSNVTSGRNVKVEYFMFPTQEAIFNQSINDTKRSDKAMLSGAWSVEQSRAKASGLASLVREEEKPEMASTNEWKIPRVNGNEILVRLYDPGVSQKSSPVLIFVHGGGWTVGNVDISKSIRL